MMVLVMRQIRDSHEKDQRIEQEKKWTYFFVEALSVPSSSSEQSPTGMLVQPKQQCRRMVKVF